MKHARVINAGLFQITWFACVAGGAVWGLGALSVMLVFSWKAGLLASDLTYAVAAAVVGAGLDTLWIFTGVLDFPGATVAPAWIVMLWVGVGLSLNHALALFRSQPLFGALLGAVAAPICYLSGQALGAVIVPDVSLLAGVAAAWFVVFGLGFSALGRMSPSSPTLGT